LIYTDYLQASFSYTTATGLSDLLDGEFGHEQVTRFLAEKGYTSEDLWKSIKKEVREIEDDDGVLIFDDTVQEKPHSKENNLISWHFDHTVNRSVKGINLLNCLYSAKGVGLPVAFELIEKSLCYSDVKTRKEKRKSPITKNEQLREMLLTCRRNQLKWRYVLADSWFSSSENIKSNTALAKSPAKTVRTQSNHIFMSLYPGALWSA